ncbi:MAG: carbohydrate ABC transporter permease [Clostridiales bacterium]|nr:carbohydrate ABC transporter permease [Clostridiales bacterium]
MIEQKTLGSRAFTLVNTLLLVLLSLFFLYPMWYVLVGSISDPFSLFVSNDLLLLPKGFSLKGYEQVFKNPNILTGYKNTLWYLSVGTVCNVLATSLGAYVLSRPNLMLKKFFSLSVVFTMYFGGGLIPTFLTVKMLGLYNSWLALILPGLIGTWNMIVMRTSFKALPASIEESARIDGANDFVILFRIILPCAKATLAVIVLYYAVSYWNNWFNAMIYLKDKNKYPLQLFLREILLANTANGATAEGFEESDMLYLEDVVRYATIIISTLPILCAYPFCQKYFLKGVMMGSVKE